MRNLAVLIISAIFLNFQAFAWNDFAFGVIKLEGYFYERPKILFFTIPHFSIDWNRPMKRTVHDCPWLTPDELDNTMAMKMMNYKFEPNVIDLNNPLMLGK